MIFLLFCVNIFEDSFIIKIYKVTSQFSRAN